MGLKSETKGNSSRYSIDLINNIKSGSFLIEGSDSETIVKAVLELAKNLFCSQDPARGSTRGHGGLCNDFQMLEKLKFLSKL